MEGRPSVLTVIAVSLSAIIGVAIVATLVSSNAQTPQVFNAGGTAISNILKAAVMPVTNSNAGLLGGTGSAY